MPSNIDPLSMKGEMLLRKFSHLSHGVQNGPPVVREMIRADYVHGMKKNIQRTLDDYTRTEKRVREGMRETERKLGHRVERVKDKFEQEKDRLRQDFTSGKDSLSNWEQKKLDRKLDAIENKMQREIDEVSKKYYDRIGQLEKKQTAAKIDLETRLENAEKAYSEMGTVSKIISGEIPPERLPAAEFAEQPSVGSIENNPLSGRKIVLEIR